MNTKSIKNLPVLMLLAGVLLVGFSMGRWLAPLAAWIGPVLIMRSYRNHKVGRGFFLVWAAYIPTFLLGFGSIWAGGFPLPIVPILAVSYAFLWSLPYLADRMISPTLKGFSSTFVYPLAATTLEFVNNHINPVGAWGVTGFTQHGNLALMQLASVTGMIGITFLMGWFAAVVNWTWENRHQSSEIRGGLTAFGIVLIIVLTFGFLRLNLTNLSETAETVRVAGITGESENIVTMRAEKASNPAEARLAVQSHWEAYFVQTVREARAGARLILWPEAAGMAFSADEATALITRAQEVARQNEVYLAIGLGLWYDDPGQAPANKLLLIDPTGSIALEHFKYGFFFGVSGNKKLQTVAAPFGLVSGVVCWDLDFPTVIQQTGQKHAGLLLVPSKDWFEIDPIHSHMAVFRAIENGMSVLRQTDTGLSIAVDPYGRILAQTDFFGATDKTLVAQVPVKHVTTVYTLFGRYFEWLCLAGFLYVVTRMVLTSRLAK